MVISNPDKTDGRIGNISEFPAHIVTDNKPDIEYVENETGPMVAVEHAAKPNIIEFGMRVLYQDYMAFKEKCERGECGQLVNVGPGCVCSRLRIRIIKEKTYQDALAYIKRMITPPPTQM